MQEPDDVTVLLATEQGNSRSDSSMAGLIDLVTSGESGKDSNVLYAHLGGQPAINGYSALFRN